jgi:hypothetical protein
MVMKASDICQLVQTADLTLAFDTSVTVRRGFLSLCDLANRINERRKVLGISEEIRLCVPAVAHTERLFDLAQEHGGDYDAAIVRRVLRERNVDVSDFTEQDAEYCAELLVQQYSTPSKWHAFKKRRCLECTGIPVQYHKFATGTGQRCGAPNDWLIIAQASRAKMLLVMEDKGQGGGYELVERQARYSDVRDALQCTFDELESRFS